MIGLSRPASMRDWMVAALWTLYLVMWAGGIVTYGLFGGVRAGDEWTAPLFLTLAGLLSLSGATPRRRLVVLLAGILGFVAEWVGLRTGILFGDYRYTDVLAPKLLDVPLVMVSAWLVLVAYVDDLFAVRGWRPAARVVGGAVLLTAIDLIIDPLAAGPLGYWIWSDGGAYYGIPAHNFAGWLVVSVIVLGIVQVVPAAPPATTSLRAGLSIVLFFTVLAAVHAMVAPTIVGVALAMFHLFVVRSPGAAQADG